MTDEQKKPAEQSAECMNRYKHSWQWVWEGGQWTNKMRCTTCGEVKTFKKRFEGQ